MDRRPGTMRTGLTWGKRLLAIALLCFSGLTIYRSYAGDGGPFEGSWWPFGGGESVSTTIDGTSSVPGASTPAPDVSVTLTGTIPAAMMELSVDTEAPGFPGSSLVDGDPDTAWACGPCRDQETPGLDETFSVTFSSPVTLDRIDIHNGMPGESYDVHNSMQLVAVEVDAGLLSPLSFANTPAVLSVGLQSVETTTVRFTVQSVHRSMADGAGFGVSEITFTGSYAPAG